MRGAWPLFLSALLLLVAAAGVARAVPIEPTARGCPAVAGVWRARADKPGVNEIITVTLRGSGSSYVGSAVTDYWYGPPGTPAPVPGHCAPGDVRRLLTGPLAAALHGDQLAWWITGDGALSEQDLCGGPVGSAHAVGRTEGRVDLARGVFDGMFLVSSGTRPVRYLHVSCAP